MKRAAAASMSCPRHAKIESRRSAALVTEEPSSTCTKLCTTSAAGAAAAAAAAAAAFRFFCVCFLLCLALAAAFAPGAASLPSRRSA